MGMPKTAAIFRYPCLQDRNIQLGLAWSLRAIREIQHAAKQRKAGTPKAPLAALCHTREARGWHLALAGRAALAGTRAPRVRSCRLQRHRCHRADDRSLRAPAVLPRPPEVDLLLAYSSSNAIDGTLSVLDVAVIRIVWGAPLANTWHRSRVTPV